MTPIFRRAIASRNPISESRLRSDPLVLGSRRRHRAPAGLARAARASVAAHAVECLQYGADDKPRELAPLEERGNLGRRAPVRLLKHDLRLPQPAIIGLT